MRLLFKHLLHEVLDNGQVKLSVVLKDVKIDWSNSESDSRITNFMARLSSTFRKHSVQMDSQEIIKQFLDHVVSQWPLKLQQEWKDFRLGKGIPRNVDALTIALKKFSANAKNTISFEPEQEKRKLPAVRTNPDPRGSAGGPSRPVIPSRGSSRSDKAVPPANYPCLKCKKVAGHWPQDCPDLSEAEKQLTIAQWKQMAKKRQYDKQQARQQNKRTKPSSYIDDLKIYMARAQESDDHFDSTIVYSNKECVLKTILDTGSDENVLTTSAFSLLNLPLPTAVVDHPSVEMADGRIAQSSGMVLIDSIRLANRLILRNINCVLLENPEPFLLVGRPLMKSIGIDPQRDLNILLGNTPLDDDQLLEDTEMIALGPIETLPEALKNLNVRTSLALKKDAQRTEIIAEYHSLTEEFSQVFRVGLDDSPPMGVEPYVPSLKPGKEPVRAIPRRYNP
jgi:hypothetical protein